MEVTTFFVAKIQAFSNICVTFSVHLASSKIISDICLYLPHTEPYITKDIDALEAKSWWLADFPAVFF